MSRYEHPLGAERFDRWILRVAGGAAGFFGGAVRPVADAVEAGALLKLIFADEIVVVTAYDGDAVVVCALAPVDDLGVAFHVQGQRPEVRSYDRVTIETWGGSRDEELEGRLND